MAVRFFATPAIRREPSASTRACSTASNTPRACRFPGISLRCTFGSWQASLSAIASAWPRTMAASRLVILRAGSGSRALPGDKPGRSAANVTSSSGFLAIARKQAVPARLNGSVGASFGPVRNLLFEVVISIPSTPRKRGHNHLRSLSEGWQARSIEKRRGMSPGSRGACHRARISRDPLAWPGRHALRQRHVDRGFSELRVEAALIELSDQRPFQLIALVEERDPEGKADMAENLGVLRPGYHGARTHHR